MCVCKIDSKINQSQTGKVWEQNNYNKCWFASALKQSFIWACSNKYLSKTYYQSINAL